MLYIKFNIFIGWSIVVGFTVISHAADLQLHVEADSLKELFR